MHEDSQGAPQPSNFVINFTLPQQLIETGLTPFINSTQDISMGGWGEGAAARARLLERGCFCVLHPSASQPR